MSLLLVLVGLNTRGVIHNPGRYVHTVSCNVLYSTLFPCPFFYIRIKIKGNWR